MRPLYIWCIFGTCLVATIITMLWVNNIVWDLEKAQQQASHEALVEENVRLALWRLDSYLAPIIAQENASPYFFYSSFYPLERAYSKMFDEVYAGEFLVPSPLMTTPSKNILLHFQIHPDGKMTSPQLPSTTMRGIAVDKYTTNKKIDIAYSLLSQLRQKVDFEHLQKILPRNIRKPKTAIVHGTPKNKRPTYTSRNAVPIQKEFHIEKEVSQNQQQMQVQKKTWFEKNQSEFRVRKQYQQLSSTNSMRNRIPQNNVGEGLMKAIWIKDVLLFIRPVMIDNEYYFQGCWIHWETLRKNLLENIHDLLPNANLKPHNHSHQEARILAMLPIQLLPGNVDFSGISQLSPIRISLMVAWGCMILATIAISVLLFGVVSISERRASFVSSVTHELRTPLTTFRMYAEMLNEGMVSEKKQKRYFATMLAEAKRLTHLVENVLEYARLERKRTQKNLQPLQVDKLLNHMQSHIEQRAVQGNMQLVMDINDELCKQMLYTDTTIVEQIVFNLVDNACKYASNGKEKRIVVSGEKTAHYFLLKVRDYGPGIQKKQKRKLFGAFSKSAEEAAHSAPGVGLGLALSRRLAKHLNGKLIHDHRVTDGAMFILYLPLYNKTT
ncbi:sensor histidine kinase [Candidatus Uabimicrobium amorphum]|uniref:histidine kinase n=1 Tax=Uabimicrobium amorphum TaxID=2596890 RepID=A0A5S9INM6_UABAM|nr:HAMP domain-containing sensor histidine kinase [Candidatus Uabimicrobium amorphum]BBM85199.1 two-component sensor histidine kinase [Candidatus Uabimicrobium amorphum]